MPQLLVTLSCTRQSPACSSVLIRAKKCRAPRCRHGQLREGGRPQALFQQRGWQGWGRDTNDVCPPAQPQVIAANASLCSGAPGALDARNHSWTGVTCDPAGHVACINLCAHRLRAGSARCTSRVPALPVLEHCRKRSINTTFLAPWCLHSHAALLCPLDQPLTPVTAARCRQLM